MAGIILLSILLISVFAAIGLLSGIDWSRDRGQGLGRCYMEELGVEPDRKEYEE
jgi:hypothetical protein